jgi:hypothetical protein
MKKYKVITGNLDWLGFIKGDYILERVDNTFWLGETPNDGRRAVILPYLLFRDVLRKHPDWFQEIIDAPKEYTKEDVLSLIDHSLNVYGNRHHAFTTADVYSDWLKNRKV